MSSWRSDDQPGVTEVLILPEWPPPRTLRRLAAALRSRLDDEADRYGFPRRGRVFEMTEAGDNWLAQVPNDACRDEVLAVLADNPGVVCVARITVRAQHRDDDGGEGLHDHRDAA